MQGNVYDVISGLPFLFHCNTWHANLDVCSFYFVLFLLDVRIPGEQSFWCEFFTRETAGHHGNVQRSSCFRPKLSIFLGRNSIKTQGMANEISYHTIGVYLSWNSHFSNPTWLHVEKSTLASCAAAWRSAVSFFSSFHIACLGSTLLFLVLAQPCPLVYCNRNRPAVACSHSLFCLLEFFTKKIFGSYFLEVICTSSLNTRIYVLFTLEDTDSWVERS